MAASGSRREYCSVFGCLNSTVIKPTLSFFKLPADAERRSEWLRLISREDLLHKPHRGYSVCEDHFAENNVLPGSRRKILKKLTLPTLKLPNLQKKDQETQTIVTQISKSVQWENTLSILTDNTTQTPAYLLANTPLATMARKRELVLETNRFEKSKTRNNEDFRILDKDKRRPPSFPSYAPTLLEMDLSETPSPEAVDVKPFMSSEWFALGNPKTTTPDPKPPSIHNEDSLSSNFAPDENTSYFQFFRGIHNDYLELPPQKKRLFKRKCLTFLHELLDEEDNRQAMSYSQDGVLNLSNSGHVSEEDRDVKPIIIEENYIVSNNV